jgi:hypothetical protein
MQPGWGFECSSLGLLAFVGIGYHSGKVLLLLACPSICG